MATQDVSKAFNAIAGTLLEAITFLMDYVQLQFDTAQLTAQTLPQVEMAERRWTSEDPGSRDSLCARGSEWRSPALLGRHGS
jgi:hypothetical protein